MSYAPPRRGWKTRSASSALRFWALFIWAFQATLKALRAQDREAVWHRSGTVRRISRPFDGVRIAARYKARRLTPYCGHSFVAHAAAGSYSGLVQYFTSRTWHPPCPWALPIKENHRVG